MRKISFFNKKENFKKKKRRKDILSNVFISRDAKALCLVSYELFQVHLFHLRTRDCHAMTRTRFNVSHFCQV